MLNWLRTLIGPSTPAAISINISDAVIARPGDLLIVRAPTEYSSSHRERCFEMLRAWQEKNCPDIKFFLVEGGFEVIVVANARDEGAPR